MRVATLSQPHCPRCDAPVKGDYKFCPECACRLRPAPPEAEEPGPRGGRSGPLLLALGGVVLLAAGYLVGVKILRPEAPRPYAPDPSPRALTVADIQDNLVLIPAGTAVYVQETVSVVPPLGDAVDRLWESFATGGGTGALEGVLARPQALSRWSRLVAAFYERTADLVEEKLRNVPARTQPFKMMTHEVSRGQYAEFLRSVEADPQVLARQAFVRDGLWRPTSGDAFKERYSRHYRDQWWRRVAEHHREREDRDVERPDWLEQEGLSDEQGTKLLIPPGWVRVDARGHVRWELEPGTEDLPVTEISWWDAHMFTAWAQAELNIPGLFMPNAAQWMRALHGDHPPRPPDDFGAIASTGWRWPWGDTSDEAGCNNLNFPRVEPEPRLQHVLRRYYWHEGKTVEGVLNMAGNAAEWVDNWVPVRADEDQAAGTYHIVTNEFDPEDPKRMLPRAYAAGGSYLAGIEDCGLPLKTTLDKCAREAHVGFRLIMLLSGLGG